MLFSGLVVCYFITFKQSTKPLNNQTTKPPNNQTTIQNTSTYEIHICQVAFNAYPQTVIASAGSPLTSSYLVTVAYRWKRKVGYPYLREHTPPFSYPFVYKAGCLREDCLLAASHFPCNLNSATL